MGKMTPSGRQRGFPQAISIYIKKEYIMRNKYVMNKRMFLLIYFKKKKNGK